MPAPIPILALDVPDAASARALLERVGPAARFVKVGLQLFTAEGPGIVRELRGAGYEVFLDLKLHDIPNTVAHAVESAARMEVQLLTLHASGGDSMLRSAAAAAAGSGLELLAVTVLTSLDATLLAEAWGRPAVNPTGEAVRLARLAVDCGIGSVVASVHEVPSLHAANPAIRVLCPGIRLTGDAPGDQARVATPADAARHGAQWVVLGRSVSAAADPAGAWARVENEMKSVAA